MTTPLEFLRTVLNSLTPKRGRDAMIGILRSLDARTLRDIGMDHYGITSMVFREDANPGSIGRAH